MPALPSLGSGFGSAGGEKRERQQVNSPQMLQPMVSDSALNLWNIEN